MGTPICISQRIENGRVPKLSAHCKCQKLTGVLLKKVRDIVFNTSVLYTVCFGLIY